MSCSSDLVYSDDQCSAFMTAIAWSYATHVGGQHFLGRTAMQKLVYFAKALGVPIPCSFEIYTYGPYSDEVTLTVDSLLADDVLIDTSTRQHYSNYRPGKNADELLAKYHDLIGQHQETIDAVVRALGQFEPQKLELIATLHFVNHRLKQILRRPPEKAKVVEEFQRVKSGRFPSEQVDSYYDALKDIGLIQLIPFR